MVNLDTTFKEYLKKLLGKETFDEDDFFAINHFFDIKKRGKISKVDFDA